MEWIKGAMSLTAPSSLSQTVVCDDDCENCPLYLKGCAKNCVRWDDLICQTCPCLASKYADSWGETKVVDPKTNSPAEMSVTTITYRALRKTLDDGEKIPNEYL